MAKIIIGTETEAQGHWSYQVTLEEAGQSREFTVTLGWRDYDLWCHGRMAPERIVRAAFEFLLARESPAEILPRFDCSLIRRYFPEVDTELPKLL